MTLLELFKKTDTEQFVSEYLKNDNETLDVIFLGKRTIEEKIKAVESFKEMITTSFNKIKEMEVERNEEFIIFAFTHSDDNSFGWDTFMVKREDILNHEQLEYVEKYGYEFDEIKNVLGYDISETSLYSHMDIDIAVAIFDELTFFGVELEEREKRIQEVKEELKESVDKLEETNFENCKPAEDVISQLRKEFGFEEPKDYEKAFDREKIQIEMEMYKKLYKLRISQEKLYLEKNKKNEE